MEDYVGKPFYSGNVFSQPPPAALPHWSKNLCHPDPTMYPRPRRAKSFAVGQRLCESPCGTHPHLGLVADLFSSQLVPFVKEGAEGEEAE